MRHEARRHGLRRHRSRGDRDWTGRGDRAGWNLSLLDCLLMPLLQCLHLLLLLVTAVDRFPNGPTDRTTDVLAPVVVTQHIPRANTVRHQTFLIFAFGNVLP
jgi:hypothetical protein